MTTYKLYITIKGSDMGPTGLDSIPRITADSPELAIEAAKDIIVDVIDEVCCAELLEVDPTDDTNIDPPIWELECEGECGYQEEWEE